MPSFKNLPKEMIEEIVSHIDSRPDLEALSRVNRQLYNTADEFLWKREIASDRPGPLHWAIDRDDEAVVRQALELGERPDKPAFAIKPKVLFHADFKWWNYEEFYYWKLHQTFDPNWFEKESSNLYDGIPLDTENVGFLVGLEEHKFHRSYWRPLHLAVSKGNTKMVELFLDKGADIEALCWGLCTCLPCPSDEVYRQARQRFFGAHSHIYSAGIDGETGFTPLHVAICHGHSDIAKLLLVRGANARAFIHRGVGVINAIHDCARHNQPDLISFMHRLGYVQTNAMTEVSPIVGTPINIAIMYGNIDTVVPLLNSFGAIIDGHCRLTGTSPLLALTVSARYDDVIKLVKVGADIHKADGLSGRTALHYLASQTKQAITPQAADESQLIRLFASGGFNIDTRCNDDQTPLMYAAKSGRLNIMRMLLCFGANPYKRCRSGFTAFDHNCRSLFLASPIYEGGKILLDARKDAYDPYDKGNITPLETVCGFGGSRMFGIRTLHDLDQFHELAKLILSRKADPNKHGEARVRPFTLAVQSGAFDIASTILEHGGRPGCGELENLLEQAARGNQYQAFDKVTYIIGIDFEKYGINRPDTDFLDHLINCAWRNKQREMAGDLIKWHMPFGQRRWIVVADRRRGTRWLKRVDKALKSSSKNSKQSCQLPIRAAVAHGGESKSDISNHEEISFKSAGNSDEKE